MTEIAIKIVNQVIQLPDPRPRLVAGCVGVYAVTLTYDAQWDNAPVRVVVFDGGLCNERISVQDTTGTVTIPPECIAHGAHGNWLQIGVLGFDGTGALRITTRAMRDGLRIDPAGVSDADVPQDPPTATPSLWEQLVSDVGNLKDLQTADTSSLVAAINELAAEIPTVDSTLTKSGQAADAAEVGARLNSLSEDIADCIKSPVSAAVGQTIKVSAVDESGKPTEWEAVDLPEQVQADWNQNDSTSADYVKNRTHYEEYGYFDFICSMETPIEGFSMPNVGESVTVKIDGVEMDYPVIDGGGFTYFGTGDFDTVLDSGGWIILSGPTGVVAFANPDTTISIKVNKIHKLDDKFINIDPFVRRFDYFFGGYYLIGPRFNKKGHSINLYKSEKFIKPKIGEMIFGYMDELAFSQIVDITYHACFVTAYVYQSYEDDNGNIVTYLNKMDNVFGTDETEMIDIANRYGYKFTESPAT